jgi:hypothetical protein
MYTMGQLKDSPKVWIMDGWLAGWLAFDDLV